MQALRDPRAVIEFVREKVHIDRLLQIAEEYSDEEVTVTVLRSLKLIFKSDPGLDNVIATFPSMVEFMCVLITMYSDSKSIVAEACFALDTALRRPHYINVMGTKWVSRLEAVKQDPRHAATIPTLDSVIKKF